VDRRRLNFVGRSMASDQHLRAVGILAFGSLIDNPGEELASAIIARKRDILTPFGVEFARSSAKRGGAPTLVPVEQGGNPVSAVILVLNISEQEAMDRLWRREIDRVGQGGHYVHRANPGPNALIIDRHENLDGIAVVLSARFSATITPLTAEHLAELAIKSARELGNGRDGITYLINAKRNGIATPLSEAYEREILRRMETRNLTEALGKIRASTRPQ
jgi:cation transport regulator ChaC